MLRCCRYFGHTREYWWNSLTWALYEDIEYQLAEDPPADRLIQVYFAANHWWSPPQRPGEAPESASEEPDVWENPYPDVTD